MIKLLRIDERLIHGQIVTGWSKLLSVSAIVVGNDKAASDDLVKMTLKMATPTGMKVTIKSVKDAITLLNDPRCESMSILVIVDNPKDALAIAEGVQGIPAINVGNYGRQEKEANHRITLSKALFANTEEIEILNQLQQTGVPCFVQMTASDEKEVLSDVLKKAK